MKTRVAVVRLLLAISLLLACAGVAQAQIHVSAARIGCLPIQKDNNLTGRVGDACNGKLSCSYKAPNPQAEGIPAASRWGCTQGMEIHYDCGDGFTKVVSVPGDAWKHGPAELDCTPHGAAAVGQTHGAAAVGQTRPSDVFFFDPAHPDQRGWPYNINTSFAPKNEIPAASIVAKGVVLRGWLARGEGNAVVYKNAKYEDDCKEGQAPPICGTRFLGYEDVHYFLVPDYDFIVSTYGANSGVLKGALLHGNPIDSKTITIPIEQPGRGVDVNSFWLPYNGIDNSGPLTIHTELNAWHARGSQHCDRYNVPLVGNVGCDLYANYAARVPAPDGWVERDFDYASALPPHAADNWWPFDPDNPDRGPAVLQPGDYVEMSGTLWQDVGHDAGQPTPCWGEGQYHNHEGWLEIHPVDSIRRLPRPWPPSPNDDLIGAAKAGVKRVLTVAPCSDAQGASPGASYSSQLAVCPNGTYGLNDPNLHTRPPQQLVPHYLKAIDGRFTDTAGQGAATTHKVDVVADCVYIQDYWPPGLKSAHYKASYVVWWTPSPLNLTGTTAHTGLPSGGPITNKSTPLQLAQSPALSATVCPTIDGKSCASFGPLGRPIGAPVMDIVTVTSGGKPAAGAAVSVSGQPTVTATTNANGVAVVTHLACFAPGGVPRVGQTTVPVRTPVPCQATVTMPGYQSASISLP
jgi:hypothetical protein